MSSCFLFGFALLFSTALVTSGTCTVFQIHTIIQGLDDVLSSGKCADYVTTSSSLSVPCDALSCIDIVEELASKLPDCALSDNGNSVNKKRELQNGLEDCSAESSASLSVEAVDSSTNSATTSTTSRSGHECSIADASTTADLYLEAASSPACGEYVAMDESTMTVFIYAPCSATQCVAVMETMVEQLPDCYTDEVNVKQDVLQSLTSCIGSSSAAGASQPNSGGECTDDEVSSLAYLANSIVASKECEAYVIATATDWYIQVPCSARTCLETMENAVQQMPDCEFEGMNYKKELGLEQQSCVNSGSASSSANNLRTAAPAPDGSASSTETSSSTVYSTSIARFTLVLVVVALC
ncbi:hypothetical protein PC129_g10256 [Phytophthora cactorum]|uniref:Elicitin n=1 Tax=Phytophthora cactorum TaxID=29920 RepID=A0A329S2G6_9STRA|nr:hypothetical protein Pcac1_g21712 [Phytophthora cactorum]KAG2818228.1 hypothetical protein PC112_g12715 [Phytophthora cactorum]KAG2820516.1 hypothetical protein PC111_g11428 [Phytophthora cactorum]KAG2854589.1 hypothetical protein PC113_g13179 [Phytophthora cactorum]KAG2899994.1 hypothetical protein PC114_g13696 [Phytophthora cactorum]